MMMMMMMMNIITMRRRGRSKMVMIQIGRMMVMIVMIIIPFYQFKFWWWYHKKNQWWFWLRLHQTTVSRPSQPAEVHRRPRLRGKAIRTLAGLILIIASYSFWSLLCDHCLITMTTLHQPRTQASLSCTGTVGTTQCSPGKIRLFSSPHKDESRKLLLIFLPIFCSAVDPNAPPQRQITASHQEFHRCVGNRIWSKFYFSANKWKIWTDLYPGWRVSPLCSSASPTRVTTRTSRQCGLLPLLLLLCSSSFSKWAFSSYPSSF